MSVNAPAGRRRVLLAGILLVALVVVGRAVQLQFVQGGNWQVRAERQHGDTVTLHPARGTIYDRNGVPLAGTRELYRISIAPHEIPNPDVVRLKLRDVAGLSPRDARRAVDTSRKWVVLRGRFESQVHDALRGIPGVYVDAVPQRFYPRGALALEVLGAVSEDGTPSGGIELEMDSVLRGKAGQATVRRDSQGRLVPGAMMRTVQPVPGRDVYLTIDAGLQEIAEAALEQSMTTTQAVGGELLLADPQTGEILAAVSRKGNLRSGSWRAVTEPYEPGSTLKPFTIAALLTANRATMADSVYAEEGVYMLGRRRLTDDHPYGWLTLADALRVSSNIGIAKVAARLYPREQYLNLRDFGFGSPTGVEYPSESGGLLRKPERWSAMSPASLAIGYEINVTPLQMAMAYGALANGGLLLEPHVIREVRARDGRVTHAMTPRAIRRVIAEDVAAKLRPALVDVVASGTAKEASLGPYDVAGKTGTARIVENGRYKPGAHTASFAGFFPADEPQVVFLVKLDEPQGAYYGGLVAAPVIKVALEAALAARNTPIDRTPIAQRPPELPSTGAIRLASSVTFAPRRQSERPGATAVVKLSDRKAAPADSTALAVPETKGLALRDAARTLHAAGFRVSIEGTGDVLSTTPSAGELLGRGRVVHVRAGRGE
ncbi:MAG TPA: penicillin-binding transpeptidase domain-containing protein [Longimicrobiales bacterium]